MKDRIVLPFKVKDIHGLESEKEGNVSIMVKPYSIQNHPPVANQLPTFETEVNKEIVITLSGYEVAEDENENLTAIEHSKPPHGDARTIGNFTCCW